MNAQAMHAPPTSEPVLGGEPAESGALIDTTGVDIRLPMLVYISREKRPGYDHNKKAGAMNALVRTSAIMSNGPFILNLDCDHYVHNSAALREGMCYMLEHILADHEAAVTGRVAANAGMSQPRILQDMFDGGGRPSAAGGVAEHVGARRAVEAAGEDDAGDVAPLRQHLPLLLSCGRVRERGRRGPVRRGRDVHGVVHELGARVGTVPRRVPAPPAQAHRRDLQRRGGGADGVPGHGAGEPGPPSS